MVYLDDDCTGGGTKFPRLEKPSGQAWCDVIDCEDPEGVAFKPVKGNAVYWENFRPDGKGYEETWHAGLPVKSGVKVGLNIWSWYLPGYAEGLEKKSAKTEL
jgi:prolyl 4-hydroxylase